MTNLPLNGRIAIIDDQIGHALPLMQVLSQKRLPYVYFSGEVKFLPVPEDNVNDFRVLFLDINLIDDAEHTNAVLKGRLIPVLNRVIASENFPYVIIYWSRHEHHKNLIEDIFNNELSDRKPIGFLSAEKLSFFSYDGTPTDDIDQKIEELFDKLTKIIQADPAHSYLLHWENQIHFSADKTLQDVFSPYPQFQNWTPNANFILKKIGESTAGKINYTNQTPLKKIQSSYLGFNYVFMDSLEYALNNSEVDNVLELKHDEEYNNRELINSINKKLLFSDDKEPLDYSGAIIQDENPKSDRIFKALLNNCCSRKFIYEEIKNENPQKSPKELEKLVDKRASHVRNEIRQTWKKIYLVVTPLCDFVQGKKENNKIIQGIIIKESVKDNIDEKSEAIFVSPKFMFENDMVVMVLHFRYFFTFGDPTHVKNLKPLFRARQQLLSEIQSKLARHISRQGILFLD